MTSFLKAAPWGLLQLTLQFRSGINLAVTILFFIFSCSG